RLFALMIGGPLGSTLFPYTTLFRSGVDDGGCVVAVGGQVHHVGFLAVAVLGVLVAGAHQAATSSARVGWVCSSCWSLVVSAVCGSGVLACSARQVASHLRALPGCAPEAWASCVPVISSARPSASACSNSARAFSRASPLPARAGLAVRGARRRVARRGVSPESGAVVVGVSVCAASVS